MTSAVAALVLPAVALEARAERFACTAELVVGYGGAVLSDWRQGETSGRIRFDLDAASGSYQEAMEGSAAIAGERMLEVRRGSEFGGVETTVAIDAMMIVKVQQSVHGIHYARLGDEGLAEIGTCVKR